MIRGNSAFRALAAAITIHGATAAQQANAGERAPAPPALPDIKTVAETSSFASTALHAEVIDVLDAIAAAAPSRAHRASMGASHQGRDLPLLILSDPAVGTAAEARGLAEREGRVVCFLFGNIHAGEVDGKEALPMLARDLLIQDTDGLLKKLIVILAPIYNADGNEQVGPIEVNRPGQVGPANGAGKRHNAQDLDLNRDFLKLEAPETRSLVRLLNEWDPHMVVDCHTTDGSYHRYIITYAGAKVPAGDPTLIDWSRDTFFPALTEGMKARHNLDTFFYGDFEGEHGNAPRGHSRWEMFPAQARYSTGYVGLRGRIAVLSEAYAYATFQERVIGTYAFCEEILRYAAANSGQVRAIARKADEWGAGRTPGSDRIALRSRAVAAPDKAVVKGWVEETRNGRAVATPQARDYECVVMNRYEPTLTVTRPKAYAVPPTLTSIVENLHLHGIKTETLKNARTAATEVYTIDKAQAATRLFQGHALIDVEATPAARDVELAAGTIIVPTDQPLGSLAAYLLEPECDDGLAAWNFLDEYLKPGTEYPILRVLRD